MCKCGAKVMDYEKQDEVVKPIDIPMDKLSSEALDGLIEEFILREGTDYGATEISLSTKKQQIYKQLEKEEIKVIFDWETLSPTIVLN